MKKYVLASLFFWWFMAYLSNGWEGTATTQGPFVSEQQCELMRNWLESRINRRKALTSFCWSDSRVKTQEYYLPKSEIQRW